MTHEELLAKIQSEIEQLRFYPWTMLRAVVELHKPMELKEHRCNNCLEKYPCPTIQAIEKELQ